jgi:hypothetical protein
MILTLISIRMMVFLKTAGGPGVRSQGHPAAAGSPANPDAR